MIKVTLIVVTVLSIAGLDAAEAASKRKKAKVRPAPISVLQAPAVARTPGPVWAGPGECFTDEGYGRYWPCGAGRDN
jgi:hypothetical protein